MGLRTAYATCTSLALYVVLKLMVPVSSFERGELPNWAWLLLSYSPRVRDGVPGGGVGTELLLYDKECRHTVPMRSIIFGWDRPHI